MEKIGEMTLMLSSFGFREHYLRSEEHEERTASLTSGNNSSGNPSYSRGALKHPYFDP